VKKICQRVDATGSATERKAGSGRPKSARSVTNIEHVEELICSQEGQSGQHLSTCDIAAELYISDGSVRHIAKKDLHVNAFYRVPAQVLNAGTKQKRLKRATVLLGRLKVRDTKRVFFTDEKFFLSKPSCQQPQQQSLGGRQES